MEKITFNLSNCNLRVKFYEKGHSIMKDVNSFLYYSHIVYGTLLEKHINTI